MRRYTILSIIRTIGGTNHRYDAVRTNTEYTGNYTCPTVATEERTKILTDFICMSNTYINSVKDETKATKPAFEIGEVTPQGRITGFKPHNSNMEVFVNNARVNTIPLTTLTKQPIVAPRPVAAVNATAATVTPVMTGSRSQQANTPDAFAALQAQILAFPDIRLATTYKADLPKNLQEFLVNFFKTYNNDRDTIFVEDKRVQTDSGRRRSLGDIYKICRYYFPTCTLKEVITLLYRTLPTVIRNGFRTSYCTTIRKRVWYYEAGSANTVANADTVDEFGNIASWYTNKL